MEGLTYLTTEIENNHDQGEIDFLPTIREAIALADKGALDVRLKLPNGKSASVKRIIARFKLENYVRDYRPEFS